MWDVYTCFEYSISENILNFFESATETGGKTMNWNQNIGHDP